MSKSARYVFTVNNPGEYKPRWDVVAMKYLVYQVERGESGTLHIQGYVRFANAKTLAAAKNAIVCQEAHMEVAQGNEQQCKDYCTKEDTRVAGPFEYGSYSATAGRKGQRSDLQALAERVTAGASNREIAVEFPAAFIKYPSGIAALRQATMPPVPREREVFVHVLWGATATGKTHRIRTSIPPEDLYVVSPGRDPWGGYESQKVICFEEFDPSKWEIHKLKELLDKWPCHLDCRYHDKEARWVEVYMLSNSSPDDWYGMWPATDRAALRRRMARVTEVLSQEQEVNLRPDPPAPTTATTTPDVQGQGGAGASTAPAAPLARTASVNLQAFVDLTDD